MSSIPEMTMIDPLHSPALRERTGAYPIRFGDRVPRTILLIETVSGHHEYWQDESSPRLVGHAGLTYPAYVSSGGHVAAIISGRLLSLKPQQFSVVDWHA